MTIYPTAADPLLQATRLPRLVCPSQIDIGDVVRLDGEPLPVVITKGDVVAGHRVFTWVTQIHTSDGRPVFEGQGVHDAGEKIMLLARAEVVPAAAIRDGDLLVFDDRDALYGLVVGDPHMSRPGVLEIPWRSGSSLHGMPRTVGWLQKNPADMLRRAPRGWRQ